MSKRIESEWYFVPVLGHNVLLTPFQAKCFAESLPSGIKPVDATRLPPKRGAASARPSLDIPKWGGAA